jgi:serine/threonine/tyrosine-interacting protein
MNKGVTHVLIVRSTLERRLDPKFPAELKYQIVEVRSRRGGARGKESDCLTAVLLQVPEGPTENLILYFPECNACIQQAIAEGGKILVHCNAGLSRSAAVVVAYVRCAPLIGCCVRTRLWG